MLAKLMRWELRLTAGRFSLAFLIYSVFCLGLPWILSLFDRDTASGYSFLTFSLGLSALEIVTLVFLFQRYRTGMYGSEGNLIFTVPTGPGWVLAAKLLTGMVWLLAAGALITAGIATAFHIIHFSAYASMLPYVVFYPGKTLPSLLVMSLASVFSTLTVIYFSVTVSRLPVWRRAGTAMGIVTFLAIFTGETVYSLLIKGGLHVAIADSVNTSAENPVVNLNTYYSWGSIWPTLLLHLTVGTVLFWATARLLARRTELR